MAYVGYDYSSGLGALGAGIDSIIKGQQDQQRKQLLSNLGARLQAGDYAGALHDAAGTGDTSTLLFLAKMAQDSRDKQTDRDYLAKGPDQYGQPSSAAPQSPLGNPGAPVPPPYTMPVPSMRGAATLGALGTAVVPNDANALPGTAGLNQTFADRLQDFQQDRGLTLNSGYRSPEQQAMLYANRDSNPNPVAPPGASMHQRGLAADLNGVTDADIAVAPQYGIANLPGDRPHFQPSETFGHTAPNLNADPDVIALRQQDRQSGDPADTPFTRGAFSPPPAASGNGPMGTSVPRMAGQPLQVATAQPQSAASGQGQSPAVDPNDPPVQVPGFKGTWTRAQAAKTDPDDTSTPDASDVADAQQKASGRSPSPQVGQRGANAEPQVQLPDGSTLPQSSLLDNPRLKNMLSYWKFAPSDAARQRIKPELDIAIADAKQQLETQQKQFGAPFPFQGGYFQKSGVGRYEKVIDPDKDPTSVQEYEYYAKQARAAGQVPAPYNDWFLSTKKAGAQNITLDQRGENEFAKVAGGAVAKRFEDLSKEGDTATTDLALLGQLRDLGATIKTGTPAAIQGWLAQHGIKVGDKVGEVEAYGSIIDKLTPQQRVPGSGATSDYEDKIFKNSLPNLLKTPEGNNIVMSTLAGLAQSKIYRAKIAEQALSGEIKPGEAIKQLRALPSPYENFTAFRKNGFKPGPGIDTSPAPGQGANGNGDTLNAARDAITRGAPRDQVIQRLRQNGIDPGDL